MPQRLVYSPRCFAFVKGPDNSITNISEYVVAGQIQRLISQASTAELTLRNPQRIFTTPTKKVYFHPMDPITIYLERLRGYPVQVFTGYLDDTPYYQLFPGTVTLNATCTLKRLVYTYFDPSLPYVNQFLAKFGWVNFFDGTARNYSALVNSPTNVKESGSLTDSSIGKLLWAILTDIGEWSDTNIWIEELPSGPNGIAARITKLYNSLIASEQTAASQFESFLQQMIGTSSQGSGGGTGGANSGGTSSTPGAVGTGTVAHQIFNYFQPLVGGYGSAGLVGNAGQESGGASIANIQLYDDPTAAHRGIWQFSQGFDITPQQLSSVAGQCGYLWSQLQGPYASVKSELQNATSASEAALKFFEDFEKAGDSSGPTREMLAEQAYQMWGNSTPSSGTTNEGIGGKQAPTSSTTSATAGGNNPASSGSKMSAIDAMISAASMINNAKLPYVYGGGHVTAGQPDHGDVGQGPGANGTNVGFDCSGCTWAVLAAGGFMPQQASSISPGSTSGAPDGIPAYLLAQRDTSSGSGSGSPECTIYSSPDHIFLSLNGEFFGTSDGFDGPGNTGPGGKGGGGGTWLTKGPDASSSSFNHYHISTTALSETVSFNPPNVSGSASGGPTGGGSSAGGGGLTEQQVISDSSAAAFTTELNFPSIADITEAMLLGSEHKGLMHDQQLLPFVQQVCEASLRQFMSLPNGDFYAFYPDYFGETGHRVPYWQIPDLEILDGAIYLNDSSLVTHQYAVGDNTYPVDDALINSLFSSAAITVYNAFLDSNAVSIDNAASQNLPKGMADVMSQAEAVNFVKRYGARPQVSNYPMVRSSLYEMFLAYQQFLLSWSNQFRTPFTFTFMPELFPGGKVAFPDHGLQMYINSVTHTWDLNEAGFTTSAVLSAPAKMVGTNNPDLPPNMVQALVEPVRTTASLNPTTGKPKKKSTQDQSNSNQQSTPVRSPAPPPPPGVTISSTGTF